MDRLFVLLESCPNETLRVTAARQLGELAQKAPEDVDAILARVRLPFLIINDQLIRL
ncbi:unnamed protein product [Taenia asiatica]|uniref:Uncharacterized protein n=1 Tax=Taenia asiatica TaxID=60517 RepID=A0A3P6PSF5_TAEAS|nr:unnamed protein product [Taenia asiatica]